MYVKDFSLPLRHHEIKIIPKTKANECLAKKKVIIAMMSYYEAMAGCTETMTNECLAKKKVIVAMKSFCETMTVCHETMTNEYLAIEIYCLTITK